jgi:AraC-like DNA-binding protein
MPLADLTALALESAASAELMLFAVYLVSSRATRSGAHYLLIALTLCLAAIMAGSLALAQAGWTVIGDAILVLDLLAPPLVYLYFAQLRRDGRPLAVADALHAAPAILGFLLWKLALLPSMDIYVDAVWLAYLALTAQLLARHFRLYAPAARQRFLLFLLAVLAAIFLLRIVLVLELPSQSAFREGLPYLAILLAVFAASGMMLFTALRHPDLLSVPGSHVKYGLTETEEAGLDALGAQMAKALAERPYLDPDFSLAGLALLLGVPERQVSRAINLRHSMNVASFLNRRRAEAAAELLTATSKPVKQVMFESGFRSKSIFNREFQRRYGVSPSAYRDEAQRQRR